jgi:hypothetical protein
MAMSKQQQQEVVDEQGLLTQRRHAAGRPVPVYKLQETVVNIVVITTVTKSNKTRAPPPLPAIFLVKRTSLEWLTHSSLQAWVLCGVADTFCIGECRRKGALEACHCPFDLIVILVCVTYPPFQTTTAQNIPVQCSVHPIPFITMGNTDSFPGEDPKTGETRSFPGSALFDSVQCGAMDNVTDEDGDGNNTTGDGSGLPKGRKRRTTSTIASKFFSQAETMCAQSPSSEAGFGTNDFEDEYEYVHKFCLEPIF